MTKSVGFDASLDARGRVHVTRSPSPQARAIMARALLDLSPGWRNVADSIRDGGRVNAWVDAALAAIDKALDTDRDE